MPPDDFAAELDRLWGQVRPLYDVAARLRARAAAPRNTATPVPADGPIPAHLLGNIWAQEWGNIYDSWRPAAARAAARPDTGSCKAKNVDAKEMVRYGERFFTSLGFAPLPETFWERSLFVKPRDRDVVCHASAWDIDYDDDLRIKMCIEINAEDFVTIHHELGHNFYQRAYSAAAALPRQRQRRLPRGDRRHHRAVGHPGVPGAGRPVPQGARRGGRHRAAAAHGARQGGLPALRPAGRPVALEGLLGRSRPPSYNKAWWELRKQYQGVAPPSPRGEEDFDPGAKYHVPGNTPYTRYFLARVLQFQFHRALCRRRPATRGRCTAARSTATPRRAGA